MLLLPGKPHFAGHVRHVRPLPPQPYPGRHLLRAGRPLGQQGAEEDAGAEEPALRRRAHTPGIIMSVIMFVSWVWIFFASVSFRHCDVPWNSTV